MTITKVCKCDGCAKVDAGYEYSFPKGWRRITIAKTGLGEDEERHACSEACAIVVLHTMADALQPAKTPPNGGAVTSGGPYR